MMYIKIKSNIFCLPYYYDVPCLFQTAFDIGWEQIRPGGIQ